MVESFNIDKKEWKTLASTVVRRSQHSLSACDGHIYAVGGVGPASKTSERYDPNTDTWAMVPAPLDRCNVAAANYDGTLVAVGGVGPRSRAGSAVENIGDVDGAKWTQMSPLLQGRINPAVVTMNKY